MSKFHVVIERSSNMLPHYLVIISSAIQNWVKMTGVDITLGSLELKIANNHIEIISDSMPLINHLSCLYGVNFRKSPGQHQLPTNFFNSRVDNNDLITIE